MSTDDVIVRLRLQDELSARLARVRAETAAMSKALENAPGPQHIRNVGLLGGAVDSLGSRLSTLDGHLVGVSRTLDSAMYTGIRRTTLALGALSAAVTLFGVNAMNQFARAHASFNVLTGSVQAGNQLFQQVSALNLKSPFDMPPLLSGAQTLLGFGFNSAQSVQMLQSLSNVAAVQQDPNEALTRMALAVGQIRQAGVLRAQDLNQLVQSGFPAYALANSIGGGNARDILKHGGQIPADQFLNLIASGQGPLARYGGAAQAMNLTPAGQWSNLKFTMQQNMADALTPAGQEFVRMAPQLTTELDHFLRGVMPEFGHLLIDLMHIGEEALPVIQPVLEGIFGGLDRGLQRLAPNGSKFVPIADKLGEALGELIYDLADPVFLNAVVDLIGVLPLMVEDIDHLMPVVSGVVSVLDKVLSLGPVQSLLGGILVTLIGYRVLSSVARAVLEFAGSIGVLRAELAAGGFVGGAGVGGRGRGRLGGDRGSSRLGMLGGLGAGTFPMIGTDFSTNGSTMLSTAENVSAGLAGGFMMGGPVGALIGGSIQGGRSVWSAAHSGAPNVGPGGVIGGQTWTPTGTDPFSLAIAGGADPMTWIRQHPEWASTHVTMVSAIESGAITVVQPVDGKAVTDHIEQYYTGQTQRK